MYATEQDIIDRYSEEELYLAFDRDGDDVLDAGAVDKALADASAEIDGYLVGKVKLPLISAPAILTSLAVDIALYKGSVGTAQTEDKRTRYEDAIKYLSKVAEGRIKLALDTAGNPVPDAGGPEISAPNQVFTRDSLENF